MADAVSRHYELLTDAIVRHRGAQPQEQGEGDSVVAAFARASDGLAAALDAQRALNSEQWPTATLLRVRIAVHTGEAQLRDEGNYFGQALNRCARLLAAVAELRESAYAECFAEAQELTTDEAIAWARRARGSRAGPREAGSRSPRPS